MRKPFLILTTILYVGLFSVNSQNAGGKNAVWEKRQNNPIIGGKNIGTVFDAYALKTSDGKYRLYTSWYDGEGIALSESSDGLNWTPPDTCISMGDAMYNRTEDGYINRPVVLQKDGMYHIWYTEQKPYYSWIMYATSKDGRKWTKFSHRPVLMADLAWENGSVLCSQVIWDEQEKIFKMWYSAGDKFDPDAIGYATSKDGIYWLKYANNPVFTGNKQGGWDQAKVAGCQVIKRKNDYLMFYIGYSDPDHAQIGMARSKDGITGWERFKGNPIIRPEKEPAWDSYAVYKPYALADPENNRWLLFYNGRKGWQESIGVAIHKGMDLEF